MNEKLSTAVPFSGSGIHGLGPIRETAVGLGTTKVGAAAGSTRGGSSGAAAAGGGGGAGPDGGSGNAIRATEGAGGGTGDEAANASVVTASLVEVGAESGLVAGGTGVPGTSNSVLQRGQRKRVPARWSGTIITCPAGHSAESACMPLSFCDRDRQPSRPLPPEGTWNCKSIPDLHVEVPLGKRDY